MADHKTIEFAIDERGFAWLRLNRPEKHNAFNENVIQEIIQVLDEIEKNSNLNFLILTANGKSFSAGADLNWMKSMVQYSEEENKEDSLKMAEMFQRLYSLEIPIIAAVDGYTIGGGVGLVAVCDYVLANKRAQFGLSEVNLGLIPAVISPYVISKMGYSFSNALFVSGKRFSSEEAHRYGLVHEVIEDDNLEKGLKECIEQFLKTGPLAMRAAKKLAKDVVKSGLNKNLNQELAERIAKLRVSPEAQEGMSALLEKRKAEWPKK